MPGNIEVCVQPEVAPAPLYLAGEILPFDLQPTGKQGGDLGGVFGRFEWKYGQVVRVVVATQAEADVLLAALSPKV